jgi:hydroxymethylbilane synthase
VLPAPAQGALAVECRTSDARTRELAGRLEHPAVRACVTAERTVLAALEAGCSAPVAAYAEIADGETGPELFLRASVTALDGSDSVRDSTSGALADAAALGRALAAELLDRGAADLMAAGAP